MSESRRQALELLAEVSTLSPDVRLGQLMAHLGLLGEAHVDKGLGEIDDDHLLAILHRHRAELGARLQGTSSSVLPPTGGSTSVSGSPTQPTGGAGG